MRVDFSDWHKGPGLVARKYTYSKMGSTRDTELEVHFDIQAGLATFTSPSFIINDLDLTRETSLRGSLRPMDDSGPEVSLSLMGRPDGKGGAVMTVFGREDQARCLKAFLDGKHMHFGVDASDGEKLIRLPLPNDVVFQTVYREVPIPMKSPGHSEMMPPMVSDMMSPRARASLAAEVVPLLVVDGQSFLAGLSRVRRRLSPVRSMRWALWTRRSSEIDAVGVVDEAVEDSVGVSRIADDVVPFVDRELAGDDRGSSSMAFFENFQQIMSCGGIERFETPVVKDEELHTPEHPQEPGITAVAARQREIGEELGNALIENGPVVTASPVSESASKPAFADAGRAAQNDIVVSVDPTALGELLE